MASALAHRGPDGSGVWSAEVGTGSGSGTVAFGHARLSIIDLAGSRQPLGSDHGCVLIQNGEIYNHKKLKRGLRDYPFLTSGDGETILALHRSHSGSSPSVAGKEGVNPAQAHVGWVSKLDGMWGFALWDPAREELILCRDSMGIKPIVRTLLDDGTLLFGSEVKALRGHADFVAQPDIDALVVRLAYEYPLDRTTLFEGVISVAPGTVETWGLDSDGRAVLTGVARYSHDLVAPEDSWDVKTQARVLLDSLRCSIEDRLMADVPVGIVLSGGLDSSLVAALAHETAQAAGKAVPACWTVADSEDNSDFLAAQMVAQHHDLAHHTHIMPETTFWEDLPRFAWHGEDLDITVVFWQSVFDEMRKDVTIGLCGQGADELHAGYPRYRDPAGHARLIQHRLDLAGGVDGSALARGDGEAWSYDSISPAPNMQGLTETLQFEMDRGQLANFQLRLGDRHSMAAGLELRVPFLGSAHRSQAHLLPLDWRLSADDEKMALREAAALTDLPREIVRRPKVPAGTATSPSLVATLIDELRPRAEEWALEYGRLTPQLLDQPDMAIGLRLFHAMHFTDAGTSIRSGSLLDVLEDVGPWPTQ